MLKDLIVRLMEEANQEAEHKGWCDTELATNKHTRDLKAQVVASLTAEADQLTADIADLSASIAEIDQAVREATEVRTAEKVKNAQTVKDAQAAQTAVAQALSVLREFYAQAATATALVQNEAAGFQDDAPATFDAPYKGLQSASGGVIGMIEVIESDFARLEADTETAEDSAADEFQRFSDESEKDKAVKTADMNHKDHMRATKQTDLNEAKKDLQNTQEELDSALAYFEKH